MEYVLFSPVGGTDPISNERDGAILHICRHYRPACAELYLSKEMLELQQKDDRYRQAALRLAEEEGFSLQLRCVERPQLVNVHLFDLFYREFEELLHQLHRDWPKHQVVVNLSSGTPAMKSALSVLATLSDFPIVAVQVASPKRSHNGRREDLKEFDLDLYWECDLDRDPAQRENRCQVLQGENLRSKLQRQAVEAHLEAYDYHAARAVGLQMGDLLSPEGAALLEAAELRSHQEWRRIRPELREKLIPKAAGDEERNLFEYLLWLQNRQRQEELADFLRGLTPSLYHLCLYAVEHHGRFPLRDYCNGDWFDPETLRRDPAGAAVYDILNQAARQPLRPGFLGSELCCRMLEGLIPAHPCVAPLTALREIEVRIRNIAAHTIVPITESLFRQRCGQTPAEIMALLRQAAQTVLGQEGLRWDSYDMMNRHIKAALNGSGTPATT